MWQRLVIIRCMALPSHLVEHDRGVGRKEGVAHRLSQQDSVGHVLDVGAAGAATYGRPTGLRRRKVARVNSSFKKVDARIKGICFIWYGSRRPDFMDQSGWEGETEATCAVAVCARFVGALNAQ